jgi:hypothetical protein
MTGILNAKPYPIRTAEQFDALLNPARWEPSPERLREIAAEFAKGVRPLRYVSEDELLYGKPYPEGNWDDIALDIPLAQRGFGT